MFKFFEKFKHLYPSTVIDKNIHLIYKVSINNNICIIHNVFYMMLINI